MKYGIEFHLGGGLFSHYLIILANLDKWLESGRIKITDELYFDSRYDTEYGWFIGHKREIPIHH